MPGQQEVAKASLDYRVQSDKIDHYDEDYHYYHDSTDYKMWQGSLQHKNQLTF